MLGNNKFHLMLKDTEVMYADFDGGNYHIKRPDLLPFRLRGAVCEPKGLQDTIKLYGKLINYLSKRVLELDRENSKKILNILSLSQSQDPETRAGIALFCNNVSVTDAYWVKTGEQSWKDMDLRTNPLSSVMQRVAMDGEEITFRGETRTPELLSQGLYAKAWFHEDDGLYLYKKSSKGNRESEIEVEVSNILDHTNVKHITYFKDKYHDSIICKCKNMTTDQLGIVSAEEFGSFCVHNNLPFENEILKLDADSIYKMNIVDYLCSNSDRHFGNWGFYMENTSGEIKKCHPLFDHNKAFDIKTMESEDGGVNGVFPNYSQKECAEYAIDKCDFKITDEIDKKIFSDKIHYETFLKRAADLGLCTIQKKMFVQKAVWDMVCYNKKGGM